MEPGNAVVAAAPPSATPWTVETSQPSGFSASASVPSAQTTAAAKIEPAAQEQDAAEAHYVVDSGVSEEELVRSIKSINDFSVELERMRARMLKRQTRH